MSGEGEVDDFLDETTLIEDEAPDAGAPPPDRSQIIAEARRQGWTTRDQFKGKPSAWVDAEEFLRRGEDILPIVRQQLTESRALQRKTEAKLDEQTRTIQELLAISRSAEDRGYQRAKRELQSRQREAVAAGDVAAYDETQAALDQLEAEGLAAKAPKVPPPPAQAPATPPPGADGVAPEVAAFVAENPWFTTSRVLNAAMQEAHVRLLKEQPELTLTQNLAKAKASIQRDYPKQFGIAPAPIVSDDDDTFEEEPPVPPTPPAKPRRNAVSPPTPPAPPQGADPLKISSITDPQERAQARQAFERYRGQITGFTEADYMKLYNEPHTEGTDFRSKRSA